MIRYMYDALGIHNIFVQISLPANTRPIKRSASLGSANKISRLPTVILYVFLFFAVPLKLSTNLAHKFFNSVLQSKQIKSATEITTMFNNLIVHKTPLIHIFFL